VLTYDPRDRLRALALHRADTFRKLLPLLFLVGLFTWGVGWLEQHYLALDSGSMVRNLTVMHSILGFAIGLLLVFRTNSAYDRWWEGRKLWGQLVNVSRNAVVKVVAWLPPQAEAEARERLAGLVARFAVELKDHLQRDATRLALDEALHPELAAIDRNRHVPSRLVLLMQAELAGLLSRGAITGQQMLALSNDITAFLDICGACERIKNTPIPYSYSSFIKKFIVVYTLTLPAALVFSLGHLAIPVVVFIFYVLASLELIAEDIEDPFGTDTNDLPLERLATQIGRNVKDLLEG